MFITNIRDFLKKFEWAIQTKMYLIKTSKVISGIKTSILKYVND